MSGRRDISPGGTIGRGTESIQQHLSSWDRAVENICEEFADFGYMDDLDDDPDDGPDGLWHQASNVSGLHTLTPAPPRYSLTDANQSHLNANANPFNDAIGLSRERPVPAPRSHVNTYCSSNSVTSQSRTNGRRLNRADSDGPLIDFDDKDSTLKSGQNDNSDFTSPGATNYNHSKLNAKDLPVRDSNISGVQSSSANNLPNSHPHARFNLVTTGSVSSSSSGLNSSAGSLAFSDLATDEPPLNAESAAPIPPVRTVQSFDSNLDNLSAVERTLEKLSSWPLNEATRANISSVSQDSIDNPGSEQFQEFGAVGGAGSQPTTYQGAMDEKPGDGNLTIQAVDDKNSERRPSEPPPSYEEAMRGMPILQSSPQRNAQVQQNRLSWQPPVQGYNGENRLSWQPVNDQLSWQQGQPPSYQHQIQRPLSYHSQASLGSVDSGRLLAYPPEQDCPGYVHHRDFYPEFTAGVTEKFDVLVAKANSWLMQNANARVLHCESPLNFSAYSLGFSANRVISTKKKKVPTATLR